MGSVEKRGKKYIMRTVVGYKNNGNPIRKSKTAVATNKRDAVKEMNRWEDELLEHLGDSKVVTKDKSFEAFAREDWLIKFAPDNIKPGTIQRYTELLEERIFPVIGNETIGSITPLNLVDIFATMKNKLNGNELSRKTKNIILSAVKSVYQAALLWRLVQYNPADGVTLGKTVMQSTNQNDPYNEIELINIFKCLLQETTQNRLFISLTIMTGGRLGEIGSLQWKHINYPDQTVTFEQSLVKLRYQSTYIQPSTKTNTIKIVAVPNAMLELLCQYQIESSHGLKYCQLQDKDNLVLGHLYHPASLAYKFDAFIKKHGIRKIKFHDLRHTAASFLFEEGVSLKEIQNILGHSNINTTASIYTHVSKERQLSSANKFDKIIPEDFSATNSATNEDSDS